MNKIITATLIGIFTFSLLGIKTTNASNSNSEQKRNENQERQAIRQEVKTQLQQGLEEKKASKEAQLTERNRIRVRFYWGRLNIRLEAYIQRLERLIERIDARITYIKENNQNINTTKIEATVQEAKDKLIETASLLDTTNTNFENLLLSTPPKELLKQLKDDVKQITTNLVEIHRLLVKVIGDIKGLRVGVTTKTSPSVSPSPTPTLTPTPTPTLTPTITPTP